MYISKLIKLLFLQFVNMAEFCSDNIVYMAENLTFIYSISTFIIFSSIFTRYKLVTYFFK